MKIVHITTGLQSGGAEMSLYRLVTNMDRDRFESIVVSLTDIGPLLGERIRHSGIRVEALGFRRGVPNPAVIAQLAALLQRMKPDLIQTWMYHADLLGGLSARLAGSSPVIWGIHYSHLERDADRSLRVVIQINRLLSSRVPTKIVCCSDAARDVHAKFGFARDKLYTIPNGVDTNEFIPDIQARASVRNEMGVPLEAPLIGLIARFHPLKDHGTFVRAAGILARSRPDARFVLCGGGVDRENEVLWSWIESAGVADKVFLMGLREDIARITASLDVATCCSVGESFGLMLAEAMACEVPCVTTDLPGPRSVISDPSFVVPVRSPDELSAAWLKALSLSPADRAAKGTRDRARITNCFSIDRMVRSYETLYQQIVVPNGIAPSRHK